MVTRLVFNRFLMRNGAFKAFYANLSPIIKREYLMSVKRNPVPCSWIKRCGFLWINSKEGFGYWSRIDIKWLDYLESLKGINNPKNYSNGNKIGV